MKRRKFLVWCGIMGRGNAAPAIQLMNANSTLSILTVSASCAGRIRPHDSTPARLVPWEVDDRDQVREKSEIRSPHLPLISLCGKIQRVTLAVDLNDK
jgi:hypothetical protein